jgi:site-specific DNA-methyltransferase (adenine-specific)
VTIELIAGDCRLVMAEMAPCSIDLIVADPPYAQTALSWDRRVVGWLGEAARVLKPSGSLWVFGSMKSFIAMADEFADWTFVQDIVWEKQNGTGFDAERFRRVHEQAVQWRLGSSRWADIYRAPQFTYDAKRRTVRAKATRVPHTGQIGAHVYATEDGGPRLVRSVIRARNGHRLGIGHGTAKPVDLLRRLIAHSCPPGGKVLDPFAGSGSTGLAAAAEGRECCLVEQSSDYVSLISHRLGLGACQACGAQPGFACSSRCSSTRSRAVMSDRTHSDSAA